MVVVICLKNRTFAVSQTTRGLYQAAQAQLWFAWKIVLLQYRKQLTSRHRLHKGVVICLKNRTFAVSQTTVDKGQSAEVWLWFAWKIVLLQYRKQLSSNSKSGVGRCDLLEKSYFCSIANNADARNHVVQEVVICLKNRTFAVSQTTNGNVYRKPCALWFAWKIVLLQYRKQHFLSGHKYTYCCDLLEKSYFCSIANNCLPIKS